MYPEQSEGGADGADASDGGGGYPWYWLYSKGCPDTGWLCAG